MASCKIDSLSELQKNSAKMKNKKLPRKFLKITSNPFNPEVLKSLVVSVAMRTKKTKVGFEEYT